MKTVIIGGVAGGATAAARLRRLDENAQIIVFERSGHVSYANCGLPYYIGGVITDPEELTLQTPESFWQRFRIDVRVKHEVLSINTEEKTVSVKNLISGEIFSETYDKLILSPGAKPVRPDMEGVNMDSVFTLRTVEDTFRIHEYIKDHDVKTAVIAGGGYIGLEMAENLTKMGIRTTIVQRPDQVMAPLDYDMACQIHGMLREKGVNLMFRRSVTGFKEAPNGVFTLLKDEDPLQSDIVILAIGVSPDTDLARNAGLKLGIKGSIVVNEKMETSAADIYAVGDAVQVKHSVTGDDTLISLAGPANKQGRIAADNICGLESSYKGSQGSSVIKIFDLTVANTGINEKTAKSAGINYDKVVLSPLSHAGYYPGAQAMTMKVLYEKDSLRILGAQIIGYEGVDKRIDVLATAIGCKLRADLLKDLDLAYAPPYSSAKDPVNMAGFIIENLNSGRVKQFHWDQIDSLPRDKSVTLLDTRTAYEYNTGHIDGFINIPVDELRERILEIPQDRSVYVICQSGLRSYIASRILSQKGYDCYNFSGGYGFYETIIREQCADANVYPCGMKK